MSLFVKSVLEGSKPDTVNQIGKENDASGTGSVADPDLQIRERPIIPEIRGERGGGRGRSVSKNVFSLRASVWSKPPRSAPEGPQ